MSKVDVIVVGKGNAALCAALAARETGAKRVVMLEAAPVEESGGNSRFAGGMMRFAYDTVADLKRLIEISEDEERSTDWDSNTVNEFYDDLYQVTAYRSDPVLSEIMITRSLETMEWLAAQGVRFVPNYRAASAVVDGRRVFFGRMPVEVAGGGPGLVAALDAAAVRAGIDVHYETRALELVYDGNRVAGVVARQGGRRVEFRAPATILACGGFEANPEWRTRYLGPGWELAKVRGTRFNMGEGLKMALDIGACPYGNWSGRHATSWEFNAPEFGDLALDHDCHRHSYPLSVMINADGRRFVDEGANFYGYTYAQYGEEVFRQRDHFAWQVFDAKVAPLLRQEYGAKITTRVRADTLEELAGKLEGVNADGFLQTVRDFNASVSDDIAFNPAILDGKHTQGIEPAKSNWANRLDTPPFEAYHVTCGITFTFGGLRIVPETGQVLDVAMKPIDGLYTAGEMVGGLFYFNYPLGSGLVAGSVFGRIAGAGAGEMVRGA